MPVAILPEVPAILEGLAAAGEAAWAWMTSSAGVTTVVAATATVAAIAGEEAARAKAEQLLKDTVASDVCLTCALKCQALACGLPGAPYRGGAHWCTSLPKGDKKDSHHMPAQGAYKNLPVGGGYLPPDLGPAIQMDPADHVQTASNPFGNPATANSYIAGQSAMIASGNFVGAQMLDVADIEAKFPGKYTAAIAQMMAYTACMKKAGTIK